MTDWNDRVGCFARVELGRVSPVTGAQAKRLCMRRGREKGERKGKGRLDRWRKKEESLWYMKDGWKRKIKRAGGRERER